MKILISDKAAPICKEIMEQGGLDVDENVGLTPEELKGIIGQYDGLVVRSATKVTPEIIDAASNLKIIGRAGAGVDNIDIKYAAKKNVIVENTPGANTNGVVELALTYMFALSRNIYTASDTMKDGRWEKKFLMGTEVFNKTLGIIGFGKIGQSVGKKSNALGMKVIAFDPFLDKNSFKEDYATIVDSFEELLEKSDIITLHIPKTEDTKYLFNKEAFQKMKKGAFLINCARGGVVNEKDLLWALNEGIIAKAGIDVYEKEPTDNTELAKHPNVICTPHLGASTKEAQANTAEMVAEQFVEYFNNNKIVHQVN